MKTECDLQVKERREGAPSRAFGCSFLLGAGQKWCARPSPTRLSPQLTQCDVALFFFFKWKKLSKQGSGQATFKNYLHEKSFEIKLRTTNMNLESPKTHTHKWLNLSRNSRAVLRFSIAVKLIQVWATTVTSHYKQ